jgi:HD-GYP domain-containing protein (c-di-GMP phosphodiesterase class II)
MTSERPYRGAASAEEAIDEISRCSGRQFDPVVVDAFMRLMAARALDAQRAAFGDQPAPTPGC